MPTPSPTIDPESLLPTAGPDAPWLAWKQDDGFDPGIPTALAAPSDQGAGATGPGGPTTGNDGSLQVLEPPPITGLLDAIVGDVVASFLGK